MSCTTRVFMSNVVMIYDESPSYRLGGYGRDGTCDCIGLIIGGLYRSDVKWNGTHGSNWAARNAVDNFRRINGISTLECGDIVFKARKPGEEKYDLPDAYKSCSDLNDYYHVGVVLSTEPLKIIHMTSPTAKVDTALGKWSYTGTLKKRYINDDDEKGGVPVSETIRGKTVVIRGGNVNSPINLRISQSTSSKIVTQIKQCSIAELFESSNGWSYIKYLGYTGYVKDEFVHEIDIGDGTESENDDVVFVNRSDLMDIYNAIGELLGFGVG